MLNADLFRDRRSQLAKIVLLLCGFYFGLAFAGQAWKARGLAQTLAVEESHLARQVAENADLTERLTYLKGPRYAVYAEAVARAELGMAKPGDRSVFVVPDPKAARLDVPLALPPAEAPQAESNAPVPTWQRWLRVFFP